MVAFDYCETQLGFVVGDNSDIFEAVACLAVAMIGQMESEKLAVCCFLIASVVLFWVPFLATMRLSRQCLVAAICCRLLGEHFGREGVAEGNLDYPDGGQKDGYLMALYNSGQQL